MDKFVETFLLDPLKALAIVAIGLVAWFIQRDYKRREDQMNEFSGKFNSLGSKLSDRIDRSEQRIKGHAHTIEQSVKDTAKNVDFIKGNFDHLKASLINSIDNLKHEVLEVEISLNRMASRVESSSEKLEEKIGNIVEIKHELDLMRGKIINIEKDQGTLNVSVSNNSANILKVARAYQGIVQKFNKTKQGKND